MAQPNSSSDNGTMICGASRNVPDEAVARRRDASAVAGGARDRRATRPLFGIVNHHMIVDWISALALLRDLSSYFHQREARYSPTVVPTLVMSALAEPVSAMLG